MSNALGVNERLSAGENRTSDDGRYQLVMQEDGNLVHTAHKGDLARVGAGADGKTGGATLCGHVG